MVVVGHAVPASAAGEGIFSLDKTSYDVDEGNAVVVGVNRAQGGTLTQDITVTLQLSGGIVDQDYPASTITQTVVFKQNTNTTFLPLSFQTLNRQRVVDPPPITVTIISTTAGEIIKPWLGPSAAPIYIHGRGAPQVMSVSPRSGVPGDAITITGQNFAAALCLPTQLKTPPAPATPDPPSPATRCVYRVLFVPQFGGGPYEATPSFVSPTMIQVQPPPAAPTSTDPNFYDLKVVVVDPTAPVVNPNYTPFLYTSVSGQTENDRYWLQAVGGPIVTSVFPLAGPVVGGTRVTIGGKNFGGCPTSVTFGGVQADMPSCQVVDGAHFSIVTKPYPAPSALVDVVVTTGAGTSLKTPESKFTFTGSPTITAITPNTGPSAGFTTVTITGTGFNGLFGAYQTCPAWTTNNLTNPPTMVPPSPLPGQPLPVMFGPLPALGCSVLSDTQMTAISPPSAVGGVVQITLNHSINGPSPFTTAANFNYVQGPVVTAISPNSGPPQGGSVVTVSGSGFAPGATVKFGTTDAAFVQYISPTQLQVTSPAGNGQVDILVTVAGTTSPAVPADLFSYNAPTVTSVVPNAGPPAGGTVVTIKGTNFTTTSTVQFGTNSVPITFISPVEIQATAPAGAIGAVDVRVTTNSGQSATNPDDLFTYTSGPIIASLNPGSSPTSGGTVVIITGTNFVAPATVSFGGTNSQAVNVNSATQITAMAPAVAAAGVIDVKITTSGGTSPVSTLSKFTYVANPPVITKVTPDSGMTVGGTTIEITGSGFLGASCPGAIKFGATVVPSCIVNSDTSITVVSPPGQSGPTILSVTTAGGTSELKQNYTYTTSSSGGSTGGSTGGNGGSTGGVSGGNLPPPTGEPVRYQLDFRWSLLVWRGQDGLAIALALKGNGQNDLTGRVTVVYGWDAANNVWRAYFTGAGGIPGASDLQAFTRGGVYWIAITAGPGVIWNGTDGG